MAENEPLYMKGNYTYDQAYAAALRAMAVPTTREEVVDAMDSDPRIINFRASLAGPNREDLEMLLGGRAIDLLEEARLVDQFGDKYVVISSAYERQLPLTGFGSNA